MALTTSLLVVDSFTSGLTEDERILRVRADAAAAVTALRTSDLPTLDAQLTAHRADPTFAYFFASETSPRDLGDVLGDIGTSGQGDLVGTSAGTTDYDRALGDLADILALATRGTDDLALPTSWADDFATYTTTPYTLYESSPGKDLQRFNQDVANKQNLLLLLARGRWSTEFLVTLSEAYWEWEHDFRAGTRPWPGIADTGADYAPSPQGTYLTDGMVALMAALTANPEAAGWAFTDFQPGTTTVDYNDEEHDIGRFAHYLFFGHRYGDSTDSDGSGATASMTALLSAIDATGGSHDASGVGPRADAYVLQDYRDAIATAEEEQARWEAEQAEWDSKSRFEKAFQMAKELGQWIKDRAEWVSTKGQWLKEAGHLALDAVSAIPVAGMPADLTSAAWYAIEGDWEDAGLSLVGLVPVYGDSLVAVRTTVKTAALIDRAGKAIGATRGTSKLLAGAKTIRDGVFHFERAEDFLAALKDPIPNVTYQYESTVYELAPEGRTLTHVSGPDLSVIERTVSSRTTSGRGAAVPGTTSSAVRSVASATTARGLENYEVEFEVRVDTNQVLAHVDGLLNGRYFDGLAPKPDGTYEAVEVTSDGEDESTSQLAWDDLVSFDNPASATLAGGVTIEITSVHRVRAT